jgi:RNA polymerase sigma-70 factor, ECF subfamily
MPRPLSALDLIPGKGSLCPIARISLTPGFGNLIHSVPVPTTIARMAPRADQAKTAPGMLEPGRADAPAGSEAHLVDRAAAGDAGAFEELVRRHSERLYLVLLRFTANADKAEETLQETFLRAWRGIGRFERRSSFFTWIYRIGINEAKRRAERRPAGVIVDADEETVEQARDPAPQLEERAENRELRSVVEDAIRKLPAEYRLPIILRDIEGITTAEAASLMELSEPAFKSRLHRARMAVRAAVEPLLEDPEDTS